MKTVASEEIISKLIELFGDRDRTYNRIYDANYFADLRWEIEYYKKNNPESNRIEFLEQDGGGEGGKESCYTVFKLDGVCYMATYSYYSHHGFDYLSRDFTIVEPVEKTITVYEPVQ